MIGEGHDVAPPGEMVRFASPDDAMPRWVPKVILMVLVGLVIVDVGESIVASLSGLLMMLLVSLFASFALEPAVNRLSARGMRRGAATGLVLIGAVLGLVLFAVAVGSVVVSEVAAFVDDAPEYVEDFERWANDRFDAEIDTDQIVEDLTEAEGPLRDLATDVASNALDFTFQVVGYLFQGFTILLFTFYLVADGPKLRRSICSLLRPERQLEVLRTWEVAIEKTGSYIYSRALLALLSAISTWLALTLIGVPYALALALWLGVTSQFIPTVGTYLGAALPLAIALFDRPASALWVLLFAVVYQQIENYLLAPRVTAATMEIHPAVAFGAVIVGASVLGPPGALLALPAAAVLQAVGSTYVARHEVVDTAMTRMPPPTQRGGRRSRTASAVDEEERLQ